MAEASTFSKGEWIVHHYYGVGQVRGVETKELDGEKSKYYRVKTRNSMFWVPVDSEENDRLRPLSTPSEIKKVIRVLKREPEEMDADHMARKKLIRDVLGDGSLEDIARLIRDLSARQFLSKLNPTEEDALKRFKERLLREWAVCLETDVEEIKGKFQDHLQKSLAKVAPA